ncbi:hypothetical protein V6R21_11610 [Limibacter armeniacum]|uniref:hypothetical protein n=1 Tax=Limibacter armeniacum TaxID=466084 RepID=UPI002FE69AD1
MTAYSLGYKTLCEQYSIDPSKGLLLSGAPGIGKTSVMKHFRQRFNGFNAKLYYCHDIRMEAMSNDSFTEGYRKKQHMIFDDFGLEGEIKRYGNTIMPMNDIIYFRHRVFKENGFKSHFTTNLSMEEIRERYDFRMVDRLSEMVNIVPLDQTESYRK